MYNMLFNKTNQISSSGPVRNVAPISLASRIDCKILSRFPSKSNAHWLRVAEATVTFLPIITSYNIIATTKLALNNLITVITFDMIQCCCLHKKILQI